MDQRRGLNTQVKLITAAAIAAVGCALLTVGLLIPPEGEIHSSVLIAFGEIMTFVAAVFGVDYAARNRKC